MYHSVVEATNGTVASVCQLDLAPLLQDVAADAVEYPLRFPLSQRPASADVQVTVDGVPSTSWSLETEPGPTVVFATPPAASSIIEARYAVSSSGEAASPPAAARSAGGPL